MRHGRQAREVSRDEASVDEVVRDKGHEGSRSKRMRRRSGDEWRAKRKTLDVS